MQIFKGDGHEEEQARKEWPSVKVHNETDEFTMLSLHESELLSEAMYGCHSILCHFRDGGFSDGRAQKNSSIVWCSTNSTHSSAIYK
jgi:hypothetical protein